MKKITSLIVALMATVCAFAQPEAGTFTITPKIGINVASATNNLWNYTYDLTDGYTFEAKSSEKLGLVVGAEAGYQVSKSFAVTAGVLYSQQGSKRDSYRHSDEMSLDDKSQFNLAYLNVPILANVYLFKGFAVKAGIQPGFLLSAKRKYDVTATGYTANYASDKEVDSKDLCNSFDFSVPVGISYEFCNIIIDARYNFGVTSIVKDDKLASDAKNGKNGVFQLTVGYKIKL